MGTSSEGDQGPEGTKEPQMDGWNISGGGKSDWRVGLTILPRSHAKMSGYVGVSASRNPEGLSGHV